MYNGRHARSAPHANAAVNLDEAFGLLVRSGAPQSLQRLLPMPLYEIAAAADVDLAADVEQSVLVARSAELQRCVLVDDRPGGTRMCAGTKSGDTAWRRVMRPLR